MKKHYVIPMLSGLFLIFGIFNFSYEYYIFLRITTFICGLYCLYINSKYCKEKEETLSIWGLLIIIATILWNPIVPIYLNKETWIVLDIIYGIFYISYSFRVKLKTLI